MARTKCHSQWKRVSKRHPCPVCDHPDWCTVAKDVACCMRVESPKAARNGGWIHQLDGELATEWQSVPVTKDPGRTDTEMDAIWRPRVERWRERGLGEIGRLASTLGVSVAALRELSAGWDGRAWTFPERNGDGLIVGVSRRFEDGAKRCAVGSRRGLSYSDGWRETDGPVLIVEGASDVASGVTLGLATIGRPSNVGGLPMLVRLLRGVKRKVVVIGERDRKPDGRWPGMEGCKSIAAGLGRALRRGVSARLLPNDAKDLRAWLNARKGAVAEAREDLMRYLR